MGMNVEIEERVADVSGATYLRRNCGEELDTRWREVERQEEGD
jgi:hypothetical protein